MKKYDYNLLESLYKIHAPSRGEKKLRKFVKRVAAATGADVRQDIHGNVYVTKGVADTYPCIVAHLDQVQHNHSKDFRVFRDGDIIFAYSAKSKAQQGLGADDKNGIWIALELLRVLPVLKCAFFVGEEIGCVGSSDADMTFFTDVRYCIQPDRRNGHDLITNISGEICSIDFLNDIDYADYGYVETSGLMTDVETLCDNGIGVSCINISCGYYNPHTDYECTSWSELCNARDFAEHICAKLLDVYPHSYENKWANFKYGNYNYYHGCGGYKDGKFQGDYWSEHDDYDDYYKGDWYGETEKNKTTSDDVDHDYELCEDILAFEPHLTFEEFVNDYGENFKTSGDELHDIFDDVMFGIQHDIIESSVEKPTANDIQ